MDINQIIPFGPADDTRIFTHPFLHLGERVPEIIMIELL
jgi:hypothetical protein